MGVVFIGSIVLSLFFITKQTAIAMSVITTDDRAPLTNTDNNTARGHDKSVALNGQRFHNTCKFNFE